MTCRLEKCKPQRGTTRQRCGQKIQKGLTQHAGGMKLTALNGEDMAVDICGGQSACRLNSTCKDQIPVGKIHGERCRVVRVRSQKMRWKVVSSSGEHGINLARYSTD